MDRLYEILDFIIILLICLAVMGLGVFLGSKLGLLSTEPESVPESQIEPIPDDLDEWIEELAQYESNGKENIKIVDTNGYYSYSCLQFQFPTFKGYVRKYGLLPNTEDAELKNLIMDCDFQKKLAKMMIEDSHSNWTHWRTSVERRGLGYPPRSQRS